MTSFRHVSSTFKSFLAFSQIVGSSISPSPNASPVLASVARNSGSRALLAGFLGLVLAAALLLPGGARAAGPELSITITHQPDPFHRGTVSIGGLGVGDKFFFNLTNTGDAPTNSPILLKAVLGEGLSLAQQWEVAPNGKSFGCGRDGVSSPISITCSTASYGLVMNAGDSVSVPIFVDVAEDAPDTVTLDTTLSGGGAPGASVIGTAPVLASPPWDIESFTSLTTDAPPAEDNYTLSGGHPFQNVTDFSFVDDPDVPGEVLEQLKDATVTLEPGFLGNPAVAPRCDNTTVGEASGNCPVGSQLGVATIRWNPLDGPGHDEDYPIFNAKPAVGFPAQFAISLNNYAFQLLSATLLPRTEGYGITVGAMDIPPVKVSHFATRFFGVPSENGSGSTGAPFLSNPLDCSEPDPSWELIADPWTHAGGYLIDGRADHADPNWKTADTTSPPVTGCEDPALASQFNLATIATKPLQETPGPIQADQPSGLQVDLDFPQSNDPTDPDAEYDASIPQNPPPKDITVKLPAGLAISPSSAEGLGACSDLASDSAGDQVRYGDTKPVKCPDSAKIGSAVATSPLLAAHDPQDDKIVGAEPIPGDVYLLKPHPGDLPIGGGSQDGKFRLLIQLENADKGLNFKLPGVAVADKQTGQITTVFTDNPQLPSKHLTVTLKSGPRAPLMTPVTCGKFDTTANLVPWGTPGVPDANKAASFDVASGPNGSGCVTAPGQRPFVPTMSAGTESSKAGAHSPFVLHIARKDGEGELSSLEATLPKGLAAKFVGIPYCSDAALAAAATRSGKAEQSNPSCPASRIGSVTVGAGPGPNPLNTKGTAYLAGPYKGAPMSVAVITPAVAGPFDLGTVVVRNALYVDPETAQGRVVSDPFPKMLDGVPLKLRSVDVNLDRPSFTLNPTSCEAKSIDVTLTSTDGATAKPTNRFQASGCEKLGFKPDLKLSLKGGTARSDHPALKATLTYPKGAYANIAKAIVSLPHSEFLAQNHIKTICTRVQFAADACPKGSIYGFVTATTPLLDAPLEGPLYLRSSSNPLPDLVAALHGQIDVDLVGRIDSHKGGIRTTFDSVPDAPVSKFVLTMQGGKKGLLVNNRNLCKSVNRADVKFTGQNGMTANSKPVVVPSCKKAGKGNGGKAKGHKRTVAWLSGLGF